MKEVFKFFKEVLKIVILSLIIVVPIRCFVFQPFIVKGISMEPNFHNGDYLIVDELTYHFRDPVRGEVIVFRYPQNPSQRFIKRVIGLPGEKVILKNGKIEIVDRFGKKKVLDESAYLSRENWLTQKTFVLKEDEYFVLGDNREHSFDSRRWGPLPKKYIIGRVVFRAWPPDSVKAFFKPLYNY